jgi:hypothetical protein
MACTLTKGHSIDCRDSIGGIESVYISEFGNITAHTVVAGEVTAITQTTSTNFFIYNLEKENGSFDSTMTTSLETGTTMYETILNFTIKKMVKTESEELRLLALNRVIMIIKDNNGNYWGMGFTRGADMNGGTNTSSSGKAYGDMNGYTLGFRSISGVPIYQVDSTIIAGLTTA